LRCKLRQDNGGKIHSLSPATETIPGLTAEESPGDSTLIVLPPHRLNEKEDILKCVSGGTARLFRDRWEGGNPIDVAVRVSPPVDLSIRKAAMSEIDRGNMAARQTEKTLRQQTGEDEAAFKSNPSRLRFATPRCSLPIPSMKRCRNFAVVPNMKSLR
jgi:hypothetical protein